MGCRTRGGPAASSRVAGEGAPRESGGEPDRRGGGAVSRARSADFSNARRCRLAARDDRQRLLRCVRGGDAPERRRVHVGRARGCRGQPSVSGATSPPNATGRPSVLAPAGRVPSAKTLSGRIWHAPSRRSTAFCLVLFIFAFAAPRVELEPERAASFPFPDRIRRRPSTRARPAVPSTPGSPRRRRRSSGSCTTRCGPLRRGAALCPARRTRRRRSCGGLLRSAPPPRRAARTWWWRPSGSSASSPRRRRR